MTAPSFRTAWRFFALAIGLSWLFTIPLALSGAALDSSQFAIVLYALGGMGPALAALGLIFFKADSQARQRYWRRLIDVARLRPIWLLITLGLVPAMTGAAAGADRLLGGSGFELERAANIIEQPLSLIPFAFYILLFGPLPEELGWRGYGLDRLLRANWPSDLKRWRLTVASLFVGVVWAVWHLPLYFIEGSYQNGLGLSGWPFWSYVGGQLISSVLYTWLFTNTGHSTMSAILFHFTQNFSGELIALSRGAEIIFFGLQALIAGVIIIRWYWQHRTNSTMSTAR